MRAHLGGNIVDAESSGGGFHDYARDERAQLTTMMIRRGRLLRRGGDERADAAARLDDAGALELGVDAHYRVGIDAEIDCELAHGRQLLADRKSTGGNGGAQTAIEL